MLNEEEPIIAALFPSISTHLAVRSVPFSFSFFYLHHTFPMRCGVRDLPFLCLLEIANAVRGRGASLACRLSWPSLGLVLLNPSIFYILADYVRRRTLPSRTRIRLPLLLSPRRPRPQRGQQPSPRRHRRARHTRAHRSLPFFPASRYTSTLPASVASSKISFVPVFRSLRQTLSAHGTRRPALPPPQN
jgi:hypothetical protein